MSVATEANAALLLLIDVAERTKDERGLFANNALTHVGRAIQAMDTSVLIGPTGSSRVPVSSAVLMFLVNAQRSLTVYLLDRKDLRPVKQAQVSLAHAIELLGTSDTFDLPKAPK
jgi:hypothetical protein